MLGQPLRSLSITDSTNRVALEWDDAPHGATVTAGTQTAGRGRLGRSWSSPPGAGLYLSVVLRHIAPQNEGRLALVVALAVAEAADQVVGRRFRTKWPNDIIGTQTDGRFVKIGGILCEARGEGEKRRIVAGIGLNLNHELEQLPQRPLFPASSLRLLTGHSLEVAEVLPVVLASLERNLNSLGEGAWPVLKEDFVTRCVGLNEVGTVTGSSGKIYGMLRGIDDEGRLVISTSTGEQAIVAGDVGLV